MRSYDPDDEYDVESAEEMGAKDWQLDFLKLNPSYVFWGPHEDYMWNDGDGWDSSLIFDTWDDFGIELDELNEVVNFYFNVRRESQDCDACGRSGYNPETKKLNDTFYDNGNPNSEGWHNKITPEECQVLLDEGRINSYNDDNLTIEEITERVNGNVKSDPFVHDGINRMILVEARAKRLGVFGNCNKCGGNGFVYTEEDAHLGVIFWLLHPRKGASRGVEVKDIQKSDVPEVLDFIREAYQRNMERFKKAVEFASVFEDNPNEAFDNLSDMSYDD